MPDLPIPLDLPSALKDAGCKPALIQTLLMLNDRQAIDEQLQLLAMQRRALLLKLHTAQREIDCLDYIVHTLRNAK